MDTEEEKILKSKITEIENKCLNEELALIMEHAKITDRESAYNLLIKYRQIWEFTQNVSTSGDSLIITLPKKEARLRGIKKSTPVFVALKTLRFFAPSGEGKLI
jgi:hypothetical protein